MDASNRTMALAQQISRDTDLSVELIGKSNSAGDAYKAASDLLNNASYYFVEYVAHGRNRDYDLLMDNIRLVEDMLRLHKIIF